MLMGCVQPAMMPNINSATARVLDAAGIQTLVADGAGCCGAIRTPPERHTTAAWPTCAATSTPGGRWSRADAQGKVEAIVMNASRLRRARSRTTATRWRTTRPMPSKARAHQRADARPQRAAARPGADAEAAGCARTGRAQLAFHPPCTLQHGQQLRGGVETHLRALGFDVQRGRQREPPVLRLGRHLLACCSPSWPTSCATASSAHLAPLQAAGHRLGQHRLHPAPAPAPRRRCGTGSRCSTTRCLKCSADAFVHGLAGTLKAALTRVNEHRLHR